jgi:hypothetical protein
MDLEVLMRPLKPRTLQATPWLTENGPKELERLFRAVVFHPSAPILIADNDRRYRKHPSHRPRHIVKPRVPEGFPFGLTCIPWPKPWAPEVTAHQTSGGRRGSAGAGLPRELGGFAQGPDRIPRL